MNLCRLGSAVAVLALLAPPASPLGSWSSETPGPTGALRVTQPSIRWRVWRGDGAQVTEVRMTLNGAPVPATYASVERSVVYAPPRPLAPGVYDVACQIAAERGDPIERAWQFSVARGARDRLAPPGPVQQKALAAANAYRRRLSLPLFRLDDRLSAAAGAHASYLERNRRTGHFELPGRPGFAGTTPRERKALFGYFGGGYEAVDYGSRSVAGAVRALFDAPYHRMPFLQPGPAVFGAGRADRHTVLEFSASDAEGAVLYPADGQRDVPASWNDKERPDPLQIHGARGTVGYPITFFHFAPDQRTIRVTGATLTTASGTPVPFYLNTPDNDPDLTTMNGVLIIPRRPLPPNSTFFVTVAAQAPSGRAISRSWSFTTGDAPRPPRPRTRGRGTSRSRRKQGARIGWQVPETSYPYEDAFQKLRRDGVEIASAYNEPVKVRLPAPQGTLALSEPAAAQQPVPEMSAGSATRARRSRSWRSTPHLSRRRAHRAGPTARGRACRRFRRDFWPVYWRPYP